jgi:hypothetical protein
MARFGGSGGGGGRSSAGMSASRDTGGFSQGQRSHSRDDDLSAQFQLKARSAAPKTMIPSALAAIGANLGDIMRSTVASKIKAGGTPVRDARGMVIGVTQNGVYTGRPREQAASVGGDDSPQMGAGAGGNIGTPDAPGDPDKPSGPVTVRRSELAKQIEEENRRRRLAGLRRLGSRSLLSGDRFTADTLGG